MVPCHSQCHAGGVSAAPTAMLVVPWCLWPSRCGGGGMVVVMSYIIGMTCCGLGPWDVGRRGGGMGRGMVVERKPEFDSLFMIFIYLFIK